MPAMNEPRPRRMRWWIPGLVVGLVVAAVWAAHARDSFVRYYIYTFVPLLGVILLANWYVFLTDLPVPTRRRLFRTGLLFFFGVAGFLGGFFRWDDTWGGTSLIKPVWRWAPRKEDAVPRAEEKVRERPQEIEGVIRDWPGYLGEGGDGVVRGIVLEPDWEASPPRLLWKRPVGVGWASFAVSGTNAITLEQRGQEEWVTCYDITCGELVWSHTAPLAPFEPAMGGRGPRTTPAVRDGRVFTQGVLGRLSCLDEESGGLLWSRDVLADLGATNLDWGKSNSPVLWKDSVIVTGGQGQGTPLLAAYSTGTGEPVWTAENGATSYSTPALLDLAGRTLLVSVNQTSVTAHDPDTGSTVWKWDWPGSFPKVGQPQRVGESRLLLTAGYGAGSFLLDVAGPVPVVVWESTRMKTKFSTALVHGGEAYGFDEGVLACIDLATGNRRWKAGRYGFGQNLLVGDTLLIQVEDGSLALVAADPDGLRELARHDALQGMTWNVPTLAGNYLLVRNDTEAACYWVTLRE